MHGATLVNLIEIIFLLVGIGVGSSLLVVAHRILLEIRLAKNRYKGPSLPPNEDMEDNSGEVGRRH